MRVVFFITLIFLSTLLPLPLLALAALLYALYWPAYELVVLGAFIDGYFGSEVIIPYYTLVTFILVFCAEWIKPRLLLYNNNHVG